MVSLQESLKTNTVRLIAKSSLAGWRFFVHQNHDSSLKPPLYFLRLFVLTNLRSLGFFVGNPPCSIKSLWWYRCAVPGWFPRDEPAKDSSLYSTANTSCSPLFLTFRMPIS